MKKTLVFCLAALTAACGGATEEAVGPQLTTLAEANAPPVASVDTDCGYMWCQFFSTSTDSDGSIAACAYEIPPGGTTYPWCNLYYEWSTEGMKDVLFRVWDDDGASDEIQFQVDARLSPITVSSEHWRTKGKDYARVTWSGAEGDEVELVRTGGDPDGPFENPRTWILENDATGDNTFEYQLEGKCIGFVYAVSELAPRTEYSYPPHRSSCGSDEGSGGKKGKGPKR